MKIGHLVDTGKTKPISKQKTENRIQKTATSGRNSGEIDEKFDYFMQNKANLRKAQMNVNSLIIKDYRKNVAFSVQKNKANSKPIKTPTKAA
jgi:hypothetical protein